MTSAAQQIVDSVQRALGCRFSLWVAELGTRSITSTNRWVSWGVSRNECIVPANSLWWIRWKNLCPNNHQELCEQLAWYAFSYILPNVYWQFYSIMIVFLVFFFGRRYDILLTLYMRLCTYGNLSYLGKIFRSLEIFFMHPWLVLSWVRLNWI